MCADFVNIYSEGRAGHLDIPIHATLAGMLNVNNRNWEQTRTFPLTGAGKVVAIMK